MSQMDGKCVTNSLFQYGAAWRSELKLDFNYV
jgi:hypothetical protein